MTIPCLPSSQGYARLGPALPPDVPCPALPCPALPCPALPCPALPLSCPTLPFLPNIRLLLLLTLCELECSTYGEVREHFNHCSSSQGGAYIDEAPVVVQYDPQASGVIDYQALMKQLLHSDYYALYLGSVDNTQNTLDATSTFDMITNLNRQFAAQGHKLQQVCLLKTVLMTLLHCKHVAGLYKNGLAKTDKPSRQHTWKAVNLAMLLANSANIDKYTPLFSIDLQLT